MAADFIRDIARPAFNVRKAMRDESYKRLSVFDEVFLRNGIFADAREEEKYDAEEAVYDNAELKERRLGRQILSFDPFYPDMEPRVFYRVDSDLEKEFYNHLTAQGVLADCDDFEARWDAFKAQQKN